jgi:molybdopterin converting factor small subunit
LYGIPRLRAGREEVVVEANTIGGALRALDQLCPELGVIAGGELNRNYIVALGGGALTRDTATELGEGDTLVLLTAQAGG